LQRTSHIHACFILFTKSTLQIPVLIAKTSVKHLHHAAVEHFDIGIYFEAYGHGTVVFSKKYEEFTLQQQTNGNTFFVKLHQLINPAIGDALCA
jgi:phosphoacetylglucosamine mutase